MPKGIKPPQVGKVTRLRFEEMEEAHDKAKEWLGQLGQYNKFS